MGYMGREPVKERKLVTEEPSNGRKETENSWKFLLMKENDWFEMLINFRADPRKSVHQVALMSFCKDTLLRALESLGAQMETVKLISKLTPQ